VVSLRLLALALALAATGARGEELLLATTTSVQDSELLAPLLERFRAESGIGVRVVAVGSGAALRMGAEGNADVVIAHAPEAEEKLLAEGAYASRLPFMENYFAIAGPPNDPAGVKQAGSALAALQRVAAAKAPWVSRADESGTHQRELSLWRGAGVDSAAPWDGFVRTGQGMGATLQVAGERRAYLLSDFGTFLAFRERTGLAILVQEDPALRNVYSVLRPSSARAPQPRAKAVEAFERFLRSPDTQLEIGAFGRDRFGEPLFRPLLDEAACGGDA
jgi:tungstate transport system substrate-binding protein